MDKITTTPEVSLDPDDWTATARTAERVVRAAAHHLAERRDAPVWQEMPDDVRGRFQTPAPREPAPLEDVADEVFEHILPYGMGNTHPRFWGWYMGGGNFTGALAEFLAAVDCSNLVGGDTAAAMVDRQVVDWMKDIVGFPKEAGGTLTSGGSMANTIALTVARNAMAGIDVRKEGVAAIPQKLAYYTSDQVHSCHAKSLGAIGLGENALRLIESDVTLRLDPGRLRQAIASDRAAGIKPACVIATAGTTNSGAIDDLIEIGEICRQEGLWFHVDACIGAFLRLSAKHRDKVAGIDLADSVAMDPHKWLSAPFEAGCVVIRDAVAQFDSFQSHGAYLEGQGRALLNAPFLSDYGFELTRGFKALKIWMSIRENGLDFFERLIDQNMSQARHLAGLINAQPKLELAAPLSLNIVCFRYLAGHSDSDHANREIMLRLQESGSAVISDTTIKGKHCLRAAITNHRTKTDDLDDLLDEIVDFGEQIDSQ